MRSDPRMFQLQYHLSNLPIAPGRQHALPGLVGRGRLYGPVMLVPPGDGLHHTPAGEIHWVVAVINLLVHPFPGSITVTGPTTPFSCHLTATSPNLAIIIGTSCIWRSTEGVKVAAREPSHAGKAVVRTISHAHYKMLITCSLEAQVLSPTLAHPHPHFLAPSGMGRWQLCSFAWLLEALFLPGCTASRSWTVTVFLCLCSSWLPSAGLRGSGPLTPAHGVIQQGQ